METATLWCEQQVDITLLVAALTHCTRITKLDLGHPDMTDARLSALLASLPRIQHLELSDMHSLVSLDFASTVLHLAATLEHLSLECCKPH